MISYIARQPILTAGKMLFGFELLYRNSAENFYPADLDGDTATNRVISNALFTFDLDSLTKGRTAFVNFTRNLLLGEIPLLLDPDKFAIEILENIHLDAAILMSLQKYKEAGFTLVLDDYTGTDIPEDFLNLLDIIKVDFRLTDRSAQKRIANNLKERNISLLAEKVEDKEDYDAAVSFGYKLFQGYFFSKPVVLKKNAISIATFSYARLLNEIIKPEPEFKKLADIIYTDAELTWLLIKKMRTLKYYRGHTVASITLALVRMGSDEVHRWIMLLLLQKVLGPEMDELIRTGLIRAVFCECLSSSMDTELQQVAFTAGLFSVIASVDESVFQSMDELGVRESLKDALDGKNDLGHALYLINAYEEGDWKKVSLLASQYFPTLNTHDLTTYYMAAVNYADSALCSN